MNTVTRLYDLDTISAELKSPDKRQGRKLGDFIDAENFQPTHNVSHLDF